MNSHSSNSGGFVSPAATNFRSWIVAGLKVLHECFFSFTSRRVFGFPGGFVFFLSYFDFV